MEKHVILDVLKKSIHDILDSGEDQKGSVIEDSHITQSLCSSIEAMFLHGEISNQSTGILYRFGKTKQSYEYDFKNFIIEFIPRNLLQALEHHKLKLTSIGFSRVWIRYALNESTILSYLESIIKDEKRLKRFYIKESLVRDEELMCAFCGMLKSIEHLVFNLDTSLPILNTWVNSDALQIAGLQHHASLKSDIDQTENTQLYDKSSSIILSNEEEILPTNLMSIRLHNGTSVPTNIFLQSPYSVVCPISHDADFHGEVNLKNYSDIGLDEEENGVNDYIFEQNKNTTEDFVKRADISSLITTSTEYDSKDKKMDCNEVEYSEVECSEVECSEVECSEVECSDLNIAQKEKFYEDTADLNSEIDEKYDNLSNESGTQNVVETKVAQDSFDQLWTQCNLNTIVQTEEVHITSIDKSPEPSDDIIFDNEIPDEIEPSKVYSSFIINKMIASTADLINNISQRRFPFRLFKVKESEQPWVFIGDDLLTRNSDLKKLMDLFPGVSESSSKSGENSVFGGLCHKCHSLLETNKVFLDYYDGQLYCFSCESKSKAVIPRDVISNWDFGPKSVSKTTKQFLSEIMVHPNINLATNSCLFDVVPELTRVRQLRHKLSLLWLQVTSCDIETSTKVREAMFPREYMLASVKEKDLYSLEDLIMLHNGALEKTLLNVIDKIAIPHVNKCMMCRMKALACDNCRDKNNLIYIHEIDYYCECSTPLCQSVIHNSCKKSATKSFYCRRCVQYLESQQPITLASFDTTYTND